MFLQVYRFSLCLASCFFLLFLSVDPTHFHRKKSPGGKVSTKASLGTIVVNFRRGSGKHDLRSSEHFSDHKSVPLILDIP